jgi:hypothetical protein
VLMIVLQSPNIPTYHIVFLFIYIFCGTENGAEDIATLPNGLAFFSSVSTQRSIRHVCRYQTVNSAESNN